MACHEVHICTFSGSAGDPDVLSVYTRDVKLKRAAGAWGREVGAPRGRIVALSRASRARLVLTVRNIEPLPLHGCVTYPAEFPTDGRVVKRDLHRLIERLRRRGYRGLWWLEFQLRGAPHVHFALAYQPRGEPEPLTAKREWLARGWYAVVGSGDPRHLRAGTYLDEWHSGPNGLQSYVAKEAAKWVQKEVPAGYENVGRFWGVFGGAAVDVRKVQAPRDQLASTVRVARAAERADRRRVGLKGRADRGVVGFTAYGAAPAVSRWLAEEGLG